MEQLKKNQPDTNRVSDPGHIARIGLLFLTPVPDLDQIPDQKNPVPDPKNELNL